MIHIYLENKPNLLSINREEALPALESQVIEIFSKLSSVESVILGVIKDDIFEFRITSYNKFIWKIVIIDLKNKEERKAFYSTQKVIKTIHTIFNTVDPFTQI